MTPRPHVSFVLIAYNQEALVRQAVEGALAQTYSPLEIVLSDDASTDRTFEIMRECAAAYRGPHRIVLNRNEQNLGVVGHTNRVAALARGSLLVFAAGDDISVPDRTAECVAVFERNPAAVAVACRLRLIDPEGAPVVGLDRQATVFTCAAAPTVEARVRGFIRTLRPTVLGCVLACDRRLFDVFGPLDPRMVAEDLCLSFRAHLLGELAVTEHVGVLYRMHDPDVWRAKGRNPEDWARGWYGEVERELWFRLQAALYPAMELDLVAAGDRGLATFDLAPHIRAIRRNAGVCRLLAGQGGRGAAGRAATVVQLLALTAEPRILAAACLRVLPRRRVETLRVLKRRALVQFRGRQAAGSAGA